MTHSLVFHTNVLCSVEAAGNDSEGWGVVNQTRMRLRVSRPPPLDRLANDVYDCFKNSRMRFVEWALAGERESLVCIGTARRVSAGFSFHRYR